MLKVSIRLESLKSLAFKIKTLRVAIDIVDNEARDQLRRQMIDEIAFVYEVNWVDAVSRFNDIVKGIDEVGHDWK